MVLSGHRVPLADVRRGIHPHPIDNPIPPTAGQRTQAIALEMSESSGPPGDHAQLVVQALGDAITPAEAPHGEDGLQPLGQWRTGPE